MERQYIQREAQVSSSRHIKLCLNPKLPSPSPLFLLCLQQARPLLFKCTGTITGTKNELHVCQLLSVLVIDWMKYHDRGKRWGAEMDLSKRTVVEGSTAMPPVLAALITRMQQIPLLQHFQPNEANAIDYRKGLGHWLKPHVDDRSAAVPHVMSSRHTVLAMHIVVALSFCGDARRQALKQARLANRRSQIIIGAAELLQ